jgi:hypothetical protein
VTVRSRDQPQARRVQRARRLQLPPIQALPQRERTLPHPTRVPLPQAHCRRRQAMRRMRRPTIKVHNKLKLPLCRLGSRRFFRRQATQLRTVLEVRPLTPLRPCRRLVRACRMPPPWRRRPRQDCRQVPRPRSRRMSAGKLRFLARPSSRRTVRERRRAQILRQRPTTQRPFPTRLPLLTPRRPHRQLTRRRRPSWRQAFRAARPRSHPRRRRRIRSWIRAPLRRPPWERSLHRPPRWLPRQCRRRRRPRQR